MEYSASAVGEVNVVTKMKATNAVIGGEGNGGVIYPASHYGRDALVGIALFLSHLAHEGKKVSELRATYPPYFIAKNRVDLTPEIDVDAILAKVKEIYKNEEINDIDGVKIDFADKWVHLRKSNTEPIIRVYSEASTMEAAEEIGQKIQIDPFCPLQLRSGITLPHIFRRHLFSPYCFDFVSFRLPCMGKHL